VFSKALLKLSATIRKRRGERGHPCLIPLSGLEKTDVEPLFNIEKLIEVT